MTAISVGRRTLAVPLSTGDVSLEHECFCFYFYFYCLLTPYQLKPQTDFVCLVDGRQLIEQLTDTSRSTESIFCLLLDHRALSPSLRKCFVAGFLLCDCLSDYTTAKHKVRLTSHSRLTFHGRIYLFVRTTFCFCFVLIVRRRLTGERSLKQLSIRIIHGRADIILLTLSLVEGYKESRQKRLVE